MALTQVSTDGVKNDAITKTKIPANQIEASELADNAVDTNAIANNAVTAGKLASGVQTTINNNAATRIITGSSNTNTLNGQSNAVIDSSGHMGLGVTPNTNLPSNADFKFLQVGTGASLFGRGNGDEDRGGIAVNYYHDGSAEKYLANGNASGIKLNDGDIDFFTAPANSSGANAAMSKTVAMRIASTTGNVGIGTQTPNANLHVQVSGTDAPIAQFSSASYTGYVGTAHADNNIGNGSKAGNIVLRGQTGVAIMGNNGTTTQVKIDADGLKFGSDTAAANALDDYEEGTWTPAFTASAGSSATTSVFSASYTKVGNQVFVICYIEVSSETGSDGGLWMVSGLPFTAKSNNHYFPISVGYWNNLEHSMTYLTGTVQPNETNILFRGVPSGTQSATTNLSYSTYSQQGAGVILSATYLVP